MRTRLLVALAVGLVVGSDPAPDGGQVVQGIPPGSRWTFTDTAGRTWVEEFGRDGVWRTYVPGKPLSRTEAKYTLTPTASPPRIDTPGPPGCGLGIYRLEGNRLLICMGERKNAGRPTTFTNRPGAGQFLYVLKRLPPSSKK